MGSSVAASTVGPAWLSLVLLHWARTPATGLVSGALKPVFQLRTTPLSANSIVSGSMAHEATR